VRYELNSYICYVEESRPPLWSSNQSSLLQNGDLLCFLWGTIWIYICYVEEIRPPLWSSGQSSLLQIQRPGFHSQRYQIFWEVVGLERSPLSLVTTIEELLGRKVVAPVYKTDIPVVWDPSCWLSDTILSTKVATNFADKRPSLGLYSSLADSGHGVS
jgi:hypothetical protein